MFLFGANLAESRILRFSLRKIFGIGQFKADRICDQLGIHPRCRVREITDNQWAAMSKLIESDPEKVGHELQRKIAQRVQHYHQIKTERGERLARGLPVRNQRTSTNAHTAKHRMGQFIKLVPHGLKKASA